MEKRLYRSPSDKIVAGVCGGVAEYFQIESSLVRLIFLVATLMYGSGLLLYILAAIIIPEGDGSIYRDGVEVVEPTDNKIEGKKTSDSFRVLAGGALVIMGAVLLIERFFHFDVMRIVIPLLIIGCGVYIIFSGTPKKS